MPDAHKNFAYSTVATAPSPAASGTSLVVASGDGAKFPAVSFNATVWPAGSQPTTANAEIVTVTAVATDTFTITRAQESTSARTVVVGDQIAATITVKTLTDVEDRLLAISASNNLFSSGSVTISGYGDVTVNTAAGQIRISAPIQTNQSAIKAFGVSDTGQTAGNTGLSTGIDWVMAGSNSITLSQSTAVGGPNTVWVQHPAWLTTAALSQNTSNYAGINSAVTGGSMTVNTSGVSVNVSAIKGVGVSNTGNTAGDVGYLTGSNFALAGSGLLTMSQSTAAGAATAYIQHPAWLTTAMASNAATISNVNLSAGTTSNNLSAFVLSNSNGLSFGLNGSTVTGSHNALTTAALSTQTLAFTLGGNFSTTNSSQILNSGYLLAGGNNVTLQQSNNTVSVSVGNYITTAMLSNAATISNINLSAGTTSNNLSAFVLSNANGNSFGLNGSTITASHSVPVVSNALQNVGSATGSGTGISQFAAHDHIHRGVGGWGITNTGNTLGTTGTDFGTAYLAASGGVSVSRSTAANQSANTVWISVPTIPVVSNALQDVGTATGSGTGVTQFAAHDHVHRGAAAWDVNGIASTFYGTQQLSAGALMSLATGGNTTRGSAQIINLLSSATTVSSVASANAIGAMASRFALEGHQHAGIYQISVAGNTAGGNTSAGAGSLVLAGGPNVTLSGATAAGGMTLSISAPAGGAGTVSSATTASRVESANVVGADAGRYALEGHQHAGLWQMSVGGNTAGGNTSAGAGSFMLAGGPNITLSGATAAGGQTLSISAAAPGAGGGATLDMFVNLDLGVETTVGFNTSNLSGRTASVIVQPLMGNYDPFPGNITANTVYLRMSMSGSAAAMSAANTSSVFLGIYTQNVSTLSLLNSVVTTWGNAANANNSTMSAGIRWLTINSSAWSVQPSFSQGHYFWAVMLRTSGQTGTGAALFGNTIWGTASATASGTIGVATVASATSLGMAPWYGVYSAATSSLPGSIGSNELNKQTDVAIFNPLIMMLRTGPQTF